MTLRKYYDEVRAKVTNVLTNLQFNGVDVLTSLKTDGRSLQIKNVADPTEDQDAVTKKYLEANGSGGVASVNSLSPTSGDVVVDLDSVAKKGSVASVGLSVPSEAYAAGWAASSQVPTKKDVYAEMEKKAESVGSDKENIILPAATTVEGRLAIGAVYSPAGWVLETGDSSKDLKITHNSGRSLTSVSVFNYTDATTKQLRIGSAAFTGVYDYDGDILQIQSLASVSERIIIYLTFE